MSQMITNWMESRLSRRGFLAWTGKVALALGMAMTGANVLALKAWAACCVGTQCTGCPNPPAVCPTGYVPSGSPTFYCDTGTLTCHSCQMCHSDVLMPPDCICEQDTGKGCGTPGLC